VNEPVNDNVARNRWLAIHAVRLGGVALTVLGIMALSNEIDWPREAGWAALIAGLTGALVLPAILVRRWRSPRP